MRHISSKSLLLVSLAVAIVLVAASWSLYTVFVKAPAELAEAAARGIREVLSVTPQVRIAQTVVIQQNTPVMELATMSRQLMVEYTWSHTWLGSTKTLQLSGVFTAKAGFDLRQPFTIDIQRSPLRVKAALPPPKLLSVTQESFQVSRDEDGWWNRISSADRERAVEELQATARAQAESSGMLEAVRTSAEDRIREIVAKNGAVTEFVSPEHL